MPQPPAGLVAGHGVADHSANEEPSLCGRGRRIDAGLEEMDDENTTSRAPSASQYRGELVTVPQSRGSRQHVRPTTPGGPWRAGRRGSRGPRGCACAAGSRVFWHGGGCSAGTCACSRRLPLEESRHGRIAGRMCASRVPAYDCHTIVTAPRGVKHRTQPVQRVVPKGCGQPWTGVPAAGYRRPAP